MQALSSLNTIAAVTADVPARSQQGNQAAGLAVELSQVGRAGSQQTGQQSTSKSSAEAIKESVQKVNDMVKTMNRELEFSVDSDTNINVVKVLDSQTNEVIRQIPSEAVVQIAKALDQLQGLLIKDKV